jgi:protein O-mannosyl-transferase
MMTRRQWWLAALMVAALAFVAAWSSVANGFAYDDTYILEKAGRHSMAGWWRDFATTYWPRSMGGDGYRPLTVIAFRAEWVIGGGKPLLFHAVNVALHVVTSMAVLGLAASILPGAGALLAGGLYAVHPVHVEAIANVVGQSELVVALLVVIAVWLYIGARNSGSLGGPGWLAIGALYLAACFFKEHAIVLPALLLVAELTVVNDRSPPRQRWARLRAPYLALAAVALAYLAARSRVVIGGGAGFVPFLPFQVVKFEPADRVLTAIGVVPDWFRLLLWPARLSAQYSPPFVEIAQGASVAQLPGLLLLLGLLGLTVACWRRSPATSFGIAWAVLTLLPSSNFLIPAGFIIAERTLLLPSVGAMIAIGSAVPWLYERVESSRVAQLALAALAVAVIATGAVHSARRNAVWRDNETLFTQSVLDAPDSYRAHHMLGQMYFERGDRARGEQHLRRALELFPHDPVVAYLLAEEYRKVGWCKPAIPLYESAFAIAPAMRKSQYGLAVCQLEELDLDAARTTALSTIRWGGDLKTARDILGAARVGRDSLAARRARGDTISHTVMP